MLTEDHDCFDEVRQEWDLQSLYSDLAEIIKKNLTGRQKKLLHGLLCGYSPKEIALIAYRKSDSKSILPDLSVLYRYIEQLVSTNTDNPPSVSWGRVRPLLEKAGYRKRFA